LRCSATSLLLQCALSAAKAPCMLARIFADRFVLLLLATIGLASVLPVRGDAAEIASLISSAAIFLLFFLNGVRLPREEVLHGVRNWRLQGAIFLFVFGAMSLAGLGLSQLFDNVLPATLALGLLFTGILPSTVQSAAAYCALAKGNVAASVVAAALINLVGVVLSPLLFAMLANVGEANVSAEAVGRIALILLLPFGLGQVAQRWFKPWVDGHKSLATWMDRISIAIAVYVAFSGAVVAGIWSIVRGDELAWLALALSVMLAVGFGGSWLLGGFMKLPRGDRITMLFSGGQKSIAIGAPLAATIFPPAIAGMVLLPTLAYHMAQLILSAPLATHLAKDKEP
jgi:solute carrier family 10 (sodium/bile acid cotransporter), member 7